MKKVKAILQTIIVLIVIYVLQTYFFTWFTIAGVKPNLFIILVLIIGLFSNKYVGLSAGVIIGFFVDLQASKFLGLNIVLLGIVGFIGEKLNKNFTKENRISITILIILVTIIYESIFYMVSAILYSYELNLFRLIITILIESIYNGILSLIIYKYAKKYGNKLEKAFNKQDIMTRYF